MTKWFTRLAVATVATLVFTPAAMAQSFSFNLFQLEGFSASRVFNFDSGYTEEFGVPVPVPFQVEVPMHNEIDLIADGAPEGGGFAKFTFAATDTTTGERVFLENIQIVEATIPFAPDADDPETARVHLAARFLREQVFPAAVGGFETPEELALEAIDFGDVQGAQLIGRYIDPSIGPMLLRLVALPHPNQEESYVLVANINLELVPVTDGPTLMSTMGGQIASSWVYLPEGS